MLIRSFGWTGILALVTALAPSLAPNLVVPARAETHRIVPEVYHRTFSRAHTPVLRVKPGDTIVTKTLDAGGQDFQDARKSEPSNPLTGPFYVEGAEPGDALVVRIDRLRMNRNWGWSAYRLGLFSLTTGAIERVYNNQYKPDLVRKGRTDLVPWELDRGRNVARLKEPASARIKLEFPTRPMLGCFGVAPPGEQVQTSGVSGSYGGNMDYNEIVEGATVYLPVYHPGALLMIGDGHAVQADGEPTGTGIETSMDVQLTVDVRKGYALAGPRVENSEYLISIGSQWEFVSGLDRALQMATTDMADWLIRDYKLEPWAAHLLIGYAARYDVITVAGSMACKVPKRYLPPR